MVWGRPTWGTDAVMRLFPANDLLLIRDFVPQGKTRAILAAMAVIGLTAATFHIYFVVKNHGLSSFEMASVPLLMVTIVVLVGRLYFFRAAMPGLSRFIFSILFTVFLVGAYGWDLLIERDLTYALLPLMWVPVVMLYNASIFGGRWAPVANSSILGLEVVIFGVALMSAPMASSDTLVHLVHVHGLFSQAVLICVAYLLAQYHSGFVAERTRAEMLEQSVTTLQQAVQLARVASTEAKEASRAKTDFLRHMSHELRTPLNAIMGFSEIMKSGAFGPIGDRRYMDYAGHIHASGQQLLRFVEDVFMLSKIGEAPGSVTIEAVSVTDAAEAAVHATTAMATDREIRVELSLPDEDITILSDSKCVSHALSSLLARAIRESPDGGLAQLCVQQNGSQVEIVVRDEGTPLTLSERAIVLDPLAQLSDPLVAAADGANAGVALDLSVVRTIAHEFGGYFSIGSAGDKGSVVTLRLPLQPPERLRAGEAA